MTVRPIDASRFGEILEQWKKDCLEDNDTQGADIISDVILQLDDMPTLTPPNEWVSVEERLPEPGERVLAANGSFVGEAYMVSHGAWMRHDGFPWEVDAWMPMPDRRPPEGEEDT